MGRRGVPQWGHDSIWGHFGPILVPFGILLTLGLLQLGSDTTSMLPSHP